MKKLFLAIFLSVSVLVLPGCSWLCPKVPGPVRVVEVPVPVKCDAPPVNTPTEFPFDKAKKEMTTFEKLRLALAELEIYRGYTKELEAVKAACTVEPGKGQIK